MSDQALRKLAEEIANIMLPPAWEDGAMEPEEARRYLRVELEARLRAFLSEQQAEPGGGPGREDLSGIIRDVAVAVVDRVEGYTAEFAPSQSEHEELYAMAEEELLSVLPELSELLGELAIKTAALKDYSSRCPDCPGDGIARGPGGDPEQCQWCDAARSALSSGLGKLAGEVLVAAIEAKGAVFNSEGQWSGNESERELEALADKVDAFLAAAPWAGRGR